ncbi:MAG: DUF3551 domain-containing protein [Bradyrhizobium sp.]|uniref:DUF3551 domain-containing protein n=1 Tax=Bradyrhizobium sp. TaxID=376 RepID=UPI0025BE083F|nr:DUF3551 domain-containing protein [Bradyrhizobium sp.]MBI5260986.1 DUF3551 domain-containing protein [Bradyrhizobium sp.]
MRALALTLAAAATILAAAPVRAQTYDPRYPVCMHVYGGVKGGGEWIDCSYISLPQCKATASGRAAMCGINPYYAGPPPRRAYSRRVPAY